VQLGGGTDIAQAMRYAESLITEPRRAMVVLITDLYEGGSVQHGAMFAWYDYEEDITAAAKQRLKDIGRGA